MEDWKGGTDGWRKEEGRTRLEEGGGTDGWRKEEGEGERRKTEEGGRRKEEGDEPANSTAREGTEGGRM